MNLWKYRSSATNAVSFAPRTGTIFDFNVHLKSTERDVSIPLGKYTVEYKANCAGEVQSLDGNGSNPSSPTI